MLAEDSFNRLFDPFNVLFPSLIPYAVTPNGLRYQRNCQSLRVGIRKIIDNRKSGSSKSAFEGDLLSILLSSDLYTGDIEKTIDELIGIIMAGNETIMFSTGNTIMHLAEEATIRDRFMQEICPVLDKTAHDFVGSLTADHTESFEFVRRCWYEAMRVCPSVSVATPSSFSKPVKIKGVVYEPHDVFLFNIEALHHDPDEWISPEKFLPDRFDPKSYLYNRPDGKPRHRFSFCPFGGGKRVCLGKTLAEAITVITIPLLMYHFEFRFIDPEQERNKPNF